MNDPLLERATFQSAAIKKDRDVETLETELTSLDGVRDVEVDPNGHTVEITYDPSKVTYGQLLQVYFSVAHNPTELNRQGPDTGTQYRSAIFAGDEAQRHVAQAYIAQLDKAGVFRAPIVTKVDDLTGFYPAEAYHQNYATRHPDNPYIARFDLPKVENLKRLFPALQQDAPVLVSVAAPQG